MTTRRPSARRHELGATTERMRAVVLVCADAEWAVVKEHLRPIRTDPSPFGEWFRWSGDEHVAFLQTGCGKVPAAAATQYVVDRWHPRILVNLGSCGGLDPARTTCGQVVLVRRTVIYDIEERGGGQGEMLRRFATDLDLSWVKQPYPLGATPGVVATADQDLDPAKTMQLQGHGAVAVDWESGAIAFVAHKLNGQRCLIVRTVSDVGLGSLPPEVFESSLRRVMPPLLDSLPEWLAAAGA